MKVITIIEILAIAACVVFGILWMIYPAEPYEPPFAVSAFLLVIMEFIKNRKRPEQELEAENGSLPNTLPQTEKATEGIKGWSFSVNGEEKKELLPGKRNVIDFGNGRIETYTLLSNDIAAAEQTLENGATSYFEIDKNGDIVNEKLPFPVSDYAIDINTDAILSSKVIDLGSGVTQHNANLKWENTATWVTDSNGLLKHYHVSKGCQIDNVNKVLRVGY
jgi:hypothetical protein